MTYPCLLFFSEAEAQPNRWIDRAPIEVAVRQAAIDLGEHQPCVSIELLRKLPIDDERKGVDVPWQFANAAALAAGCTKSWDRAPTDASRSER
jgi:hypothetical protein